MNMKTSYNVFIMGLFKTKDSSMPLTLQRTLPEALSHYCGIWKSHTTESASSNYTSSLHVPLIMYCARTSFKTIYT